MSRVVRLVVLALLVLGAAWLYAAPAAAATWCGTVATDDRPATVGGRQIRVVYAIPSDGADRSATVVPQLSADVDAIEEWWRGQDATRTARFDRAVFGCGPQADVELLRLARSGEEVRTGDRAFGLIADAVTALDDRSPYFKYLVYYDGPLADERLCGQGGGFLDGPGVAIVYVGSCAGEPSAVIAAHELLHAMGAVPTTGPPHPCSGDDRAHVCDSSMDLMWPFATLVPLSSLLLDVNRDDYYAHSGSWPDLQDSGWLRHLDAQVDLAVGIAGTGRIRSDLPGVDCTVSCSIQWDAATAVTLTATPADGERLVRWTGACSGSDGCAVSLAQSTQVAALFAPATFALRVAVSGRGAVRGAGGLIACPARCVAAVPSHTPTTLTARPAKGWRLARWTGGCRGTARTCVLPMRKAASARAAFARTSS